MPKDETKFMVLRDNAEKTGWHFADAFDCAGMEITSLNTGDYTIVGLENKLSIERKASVAEIATNINEPRFEKELTRLDDFEYPFVICEFNFKDIINFPAGLPPRIKDKITMSPKFIMKKISEYSLYHKAKWMFCDDKYGAFLMARSIMKRLHEKYNLAKS
jgi:hypothetical protein